MKYFVILLILIGLIIPQAFGVSEEIIHGRSSFELLPSEIITDKPISFEIVFMYYDHPYSIESLSPIIEINPSSALSNVHVEIEPISVYPGQIFRIPVNMTINSEIEHKKIFLTLSFIGNNPKTDTVYKSGWTESAIIDVIQNDVDSEELPSSQEYEFERLTGARCDGEVALCYGTFYNGTTIPVQCDYRHSCGVIPFDNDVFFQSPLKQFKSGIAIDKITCKENLQLIIKNNGNPACVKSDTIPKLVERNAIKLSSFYQSRPLIERLHVAMAIIQFSDIPTTILGLDHDKILGIEINDEELNKIPNAQEYYEKKIREIIPFDVPIKVTFGKYWE